MAWLEAAAGRPEPQLRLMGLVAAWDAEDALTRRQLLWTFFEELDVEGEVSTEWCHAYA